MKKMIGLLSALLVCSLWASEPEIRYAAPAKTGNGDGLSTENAAAVDDQTFWSSINTDLQKGPVTVRLLPGPYVISIKGKQSNAVKITGVGHDRNLLTIAGAPDRGSVFSRSPADDQTRTMKNYLHLFVIADCRNVVIDGLFFTGDSVCGYVTQILDSQNITMRNCHWLNMRGVYLAASGAHGEKTRNVLWENCTFENLGIDSHAHMLYNANSAAGLTVRNCKFTDCTGDYVRFRNNVDDITVENCEFENTARIERPCSFIAIPLFVDFDEPRHYEYFSKKMTVRNNRFVFHKPTSNAALLYHHSGFNPPGKHYLMSKTEAAELQKMSVADGRKFLGERLGVEMDEIVFENNQLSGCHPAVLYQSRPNWGAEKQFPKAEYDTDVALDRFFHLP